MGSEQDGAAKVGPSLHISRILSDHQLFSQYEYIHMVHPCFCAISSGIRIVQSRKALSNFVSNPTPVITIPKRHAQFTQMSLH